MYKINPAAYSSVFVLPREIADKHLRMAGKAQLKVLLWLFSNPEGGGDKDRISRETGIPKDEIDDAALYWIEAGIITADDCEVPAEVSSEPLSVFNRPTVAEPVYEGLRKNVTEAEETGIENEKPKQERIHYVKPSMKDIARRLSESEDLRSLFSEIQSLFGRTLGFDGQTCILALHDYYGLPSDVILMLCGYAKTIGKQSSMSYIMKMGESWAEREITTFEAAAEKIARLESTEKVWTELRIRTGIENPRPTSKQTEFLEIWLNDFKFGSDMIYFAYEKTVEKKGNISFGYMNGILRSWWEKGYKDISDVEEAERKFAEEQANKKNAAAKKASAKKELPNPVSFDMELAMRQSLLLDPTKTKKGE